MGGNDALDDGGSFDVCFCSERSTRGSRTVYVGQVLLGSDYLSHGFVS